MPDDAPELMWGMSVYKDGIVSLSATLYVNDIDMDLEGELSGVEYLVIGKDGTVTLR